MDEIICPYCGHEHIDSQEFFSEMSDNTDVQCESCGKEFEAYRDFDVTYFTAKSKEESDDSGKATE